jgi:hypothetical protein
LEGAFRFGGCNYGWTLQSMLRCDLGDLIGLNMWCKFIWIFFDNLGYDVMVDVQGIDLRKNAQWKPWFYPAIDQGIL